MPQRKPLSTYEQGLLRSYLDDPDLLSIEDRDEGSRIAQTYLKTGAGDRAKAPQGRGTFDRPLMQSFQSLVRSNRPVVPKTTPEQRAANEAAAVKAQEGWSPVRRAFAEVPGAVVNFGKGLTVSDLLDPDIRDWSKAEKAGALLSGVVPLMAVPKKIVGAGRKLVGGLFSRLDEALDLIPKKGLHHNKARKILRDNSSAEERAYRGVDDFLATQGDRVTPEALAAHLEAHPAPFPTVKTLGGSSDKAPMLSVGRVAGDQRFRVSDPDGRVLSYHDTLTEAMEHAQRSPKYSDYQVPGGENYRETLQTLPGQPNNPYEAHVGNMERKYGVGYDTEALTPDERTMQGVLWDKSQQTGAGMRESQFRSSHFDDPNILVHTRSGEHTLPTGERGLVIENVQSDWMQAGRKEGFRVSPKSMKAELTDGGYWKVHDADSDQFVANVWGIDDNTEAGAIAEARRRIDAGDPVMGQAVSDGPFKESWPNLGMEREIVDAAESGAGWIAITPSEVLRNRGETIGPQFQDQRLPNILEKLLAPFGGGSKEMAEISKGVFAPIVRLTPEMRKRILKEGIPLMALMAAIHEAGGEESPPPKGTMRDVLSP